jgi:2-polyprenyl-6-hydroxyphenyl methylase/3-demethylubiquinone-9 3-methyltransferase
VLPFPPPALAASERTIIGRACDRAGIETRRAAGHHSIVSRLEDLYRDRKLADGFPGLDRLAHAAFSHEVTSRPDDAARIERLFTYLGRLIDLSRHRNVVVLGCGPHPEPARVLLEMGYTVVGVEPVPSFVDTAREYLGDAALVKLGAAEDMPLPSASQDVVVFESVLEHVDSIPRSLAEIHRVLAPGGVLYISTTNRHRLSLRGFNGEFTVPFYNWFPRLVKESYVFQHLHYDPGLANHTLRPAVHWLSFADLCSRGRDAGFAQFYSILDLLRPGDPSITRSRMRRILLARVQRSPWLRALALTQVGHVIFMLKRR